MTEQIIEIDVEKIKINPNQPRQEFNKERLIELSNSIKENGLINPIQVKQNKENPEYYDLVCGERRLKAHQLIGLKTIKSIVKSYNSKQDEMIESLIENLHRDNLNSIERENFIEKLWKTGKFKTKVDLGKSIGLSGEIIRNVLIAKELRDKLNISKNISTRTIRDISFLNNLQDVQKIIKKVEKKEINSLKARDFSKVIKNSFNEVKKSLFSNEITLKQAEKINKIKNKKLRNEMLLAHKQVKKIGKDIEKSIEQVNPKTKIDIVNINEKISNFRYDTLETQRQIKETLNSLVNCLKDINLLDDKQLNKLNHFQELFEMELLNSLEMVETLRERIGGL